MTQTELIWFGVAAGIVLLGLLRRGMTPPEERLYIPWLPVASVALELLALLMFAMSAAFLAIAITK